MITVIFSDSSITYDSKALTQYDSNIVLQIKGLDVPGNVQVHFAKKGMEAIVKIPEVDQDKNISVTVPNSILQYDGEMTVYVYSLDASTGKTYKSITFFVNPREKPQGYTVPEEEPVTLSAEFIAENTPGETMEERVAYLEDAVQKLILSGLGVI